jgi:Na+/H+ antiporter NhaD/arsenite permease-like protein
MSFPPAIIILAAVLVLIAVRQVGSVRLPIWLVMAAGALAALVTGSIAPRDALAAIDLDVMLFLLGMFIVGRALEDSGLLLSLAHRIFGRTRRTGGLVALLLYAAGLLSALLMNDTLAVIGTPVVLYHATRHRMSPKLLLLALAFAVTTGSVLSPIGNPQNLLVALHGGVPNPFVTFLVYLGPPTLASLGLCWVALRLAFSREFHDQELDHTEEPIHDPRLALLSRVSLIVIAVLVAAKVVIVSVGLPVDFRLTWIALAGAAPILLASARRLSVLARIDWATLGFFAAMFVLMDAVWRSGFLQRFIAGRDLASVPVVLGLGIGASQLVSNVPFVALFLPLLEGVALPVTMALAAGSTIAGNLFVLGAASNVIVIQAAENAGTREAGRSPRGRAVPLRHRSLTFLDFARVGLPLTIAQALVFWGWLALLELIG